MKPRHVPDQQGTFLQPSHFGQETIISGDRQFPGDPGQFTRTSDEMGSPMNPIESSVSIQERNVKLVAALNLLTSAGALNSLVKAGHLDSSDEHHGRFERQYNERAPHVRQGAIKKRDRLTNRARIVFARAAGYITSEQESEYLSLYPDKAPRSHTDSPPPKIPKEPPFPEDVKPDIDREFRKFRRQFAVPERDGANNAHHKKNVADRARARKVYAGKLQGHLKLILKPEISK